MVKLEPEKIKIGFEDQSLAYGKNTKLAPSGTITNTHINLSGFL